MNRPILISLLRRAIRQLDLDAMNEAGKRSAMIATHPFSKQVNLHPFLLSSSSSLTNPTILAPLPSKTAWIIPNNNSPCSQKLASVLETQPTKTNAKPADTKQSQAPAGKGGDGRPSLEKQLIVYNTLRDGLPKLFTHILDYRIYNKDLIFINNLIGKTTKGLAAYIQQVSFLRTVAHFKFAYVRFDILNMSHDVEAARVTVRWRIVGVSLLKVIFRFFSFKLWKREELQKQVANWYDGISYFDIGSDGLVWRHIADKIEEDKDRLAAKTKTPLAAAKLALLAVALKPGVTGEPSWSSELLFSFFQ